MQKIPATNRTAQLQHRRMEVEMTLRHLEKEKRQAESNTEWLNYAAYQSRLGLLERVAEWYRKEMKEIDGALDFSREPDPLPTPAAGGLPRYSNNYRPRDK